jgi:asparaginyl-tRNA synthetase
MLVSAGLAPPTDSESSWDFGMDEERRLVDMLGGQPLFLTHHPGAIKYFNLRREAESACSVDLIVPPIGEMSGGGERETSRVRVEQQLGGSRMLGRIVEVGGSRTEFEWYLALLDDPGLPTRAGFGLGLERFVAFILNVDDVVRCIEFPSTDRFLFP